MGIPAIISDSIPHSSLPRLILKKPGKSKIIYVIISVHFSNLSIYFSQTFVRRKEKQCPTVVSPVAVPGVSGQPVGGPILLSPAKDLNSMASKEVPCHMLVDPCSDIALYLKR